MESTAHFRTAHTRCFHVDCVQQALVLTNDIVQSSLQSLRQHLDVLFAFAESVALLDMLASFAETVALADTPFSRPLLTEDEPVRLATPRPLVDVKALVNFDSAPARS